MGHILNLWKIKENISIFIPFKQKDIKESKSSFISYPAAVSNFCRCEALMRLPRGRARRAHLCRFTTGGRGGIRTHDEFPHTAFRERPVQPLLHPSFLWYREMGGPDSGESIGLVIPVAGVRFPSGALPGLIDNFSLFCNLLLDKSC